MTLLFYRDETTRRQRIAGLLRSVSLRLSTSRLASVNRNRGFHRGWVTALNPAKFEITLVINE